MKSIKKINLEELKKELGNSHPAVPEDYFAQLEKNIVLKTTESTLSKLQIKQPFLVPDGYFEKLEENLNIISTPEYKINQIAGKENIYTTPENYFDGLAFEIQNKVRKQSTNTFNLAEFVLKPVPQFALAACLLLIIGLIYFNRGDENQAFKNNVALQNISKLEVANYLADNSTGNEEIIIEEIAANKNIKINVLSKKVSKEINTENLDLELNEEDIEEISTENL